jgi:hypothetical protein
MGGVSVSKPLFADGWGLIFDRLTGWIVRNNPAQSCIFVNNATRKYLNYSARG